jgi:hypothetical protein
VGAIRISDHAAALGHALRLHCRRALTTARRFCSVVCEAAFIAEVHAWPPACLPEARTSLALLEPLGPADAWLMVAAISCLTIADIAEVEAAVIMGTVGKPVRMAGSGRTGQRFLAEATSAQHDKHKGRIMNNCPVLTTIYDDDNYTVGACIPAQTDTGAALFLQATPLKDGLPLFKRTLRAPYPQGIAVPGGPKPPSPFDLVGAAKCYLTRVIAFAVAGKPLCAEGVEHRAPDIFRMADDKLLAKEMCPI